MEDVWIVPKNIRQIGESHSHISIFIEDYAATFISQFARTMGTCIRQGICLGRIYEDAQRISIVIEGVVADSEEIEPADRTFTEKAKCRMDEDLHNFFPGMRMIGRLVMDTQVQQIPDSRIRQLLSEKYDAKEDQSLQREGENPLPSDWSRQQIQFVMLAGKEDGIRSFYVSSYGAVEQLENYYIYYDKNEKMQNYLITWHEKLRGLGVSESERQPREKNEDGGNERGAFEENEDGKEAFVRNGYSREESDGRNYLRRIKRKSGLFPITECAACLILVCACVIGITGINNYEKMKELEVTMKNFTGNFSGPGISANSEETAQQEENEVSGEKEGESTGVREAAADPQNMDLPIYDPENEALNHDEVQDSEMSDDGQNAEDAGKDTDGSEVQDTDGSEVQDMETADIAESANENGTQGPESAAEDTVQQTELQTQTVSYREYIVKQGDTLSSICYSFYQDRSKVSEICRLNGITDPDTIAIGQKILLP